MKRGIMVAASLALLLTGCSSGASITLDKDSWRNAKVQCDPIGDDWQMAKVRAEFGQADVIFNANTLEVNRVAFGFQENLTMEAEPEAGIGTASMQRKGDGYVVTGEARHVDANYEQTYNVTFSCPKKKV